MDKIVDTEILTTVTLPRETKMTNMPKKEFVPWKSFQERLNELLNTTNSTEKDVSRELGLGSGTLSGWRKSGKAPKLAFLALEGLLRRRGKTPTGELTVILQATEQEWNTIRPIIDMIPLKYHVLK